MSLPPVGFYAAAWVALVPLIARWADRRPDFTLAREIYAVFLVAAVATGFWTLFLPNKLHSVVNGFGLLFAPIPITLAFWAAGWVRERFGVGVGLAVLAVDVLAVEFVALHASIGTAWLALGHTQATAVPFLKPVELGGVPLMSAWVLALNITAYLGIERMRTRSQRRWADRSLVVTAFAGLLVLPVAYGSVQGMARDVPPGYLRIGVAQPNLPATAWDLPQDETRVNYVAAASDAMLRNSDSDETASRTLRTGYRSMPESDARPDLLVWPRATLPVYGDAMRIDRLHQKVGLWAERRGVALLTGARMASDTTGQRDPNARYHPLPASKTTQSALLFNSKRRTFERYDQMRRVPMLDALPMSIARLAGDSGPAFRNGSRRRLLAAGRAEVGAMVGFESIYGDHARRFVRDGAHLIVALPASSSSTGREQHHALMRLRAMETGRAVVTAAAGQGSALALPDGRVVRLTSDAAPETALVDAPIYSETTLYVRWGDWLGFLALGLAFFGHAVLFWFYRMTPQKRRVAPKVHLTTVPGM